MKKIILTITLVIFAILGLTVLFISFYGVSSGDSYRSDNAMFEKLKNTAVRVEGNKRYLGDASMENRDGFHILHLKGTPYEIGYQHGVLLKEEVLS